MSNYSQTVSSVATKGGATEQGIECFEKGNLRKIINDAIQCAYLSVNKDTQPNKWGEGGEE